MIRRRIAGIVDGEELVDGDVGTVGKIGLDVLGQDPFTTGQSAGWRSRRFGHGGRMELGFGRCRVTGLTTRAERDGAHRRQRESSTRPTR